MKIVRNPSRWLKNLSRAAAIVALAMQTQAALSQETTSWFGGSPSGSAAGIMDSNRDGLGMQFRGGHVAGDTVGRSESITHISLSPYVNAGDGLIFGDSRLLRANEGGLAWSFGGGYRHYIADWDVVIGGNSYFDRDQLTGAHLKQWGAGAEILAYGWEARGNYYQTFGETFSMVGQRIDPGSTAFTGNNITFTRIDTFAEALKGFDAEVGMLLPGNFAERFDLRAFGGGYYYEGPNVDGFAGWSTRLQADIGRWLELGLKLTDDQEFNTTLSFSAAVYFGGFKSQEHTSRSAIQRFRDPVRRNMNVVTTLSDVANPGQVAINPDTNLPFTVAHVNSNDLVGPFLGTVEDPFASLTTGLGAGTDIVFVHAGSRFDLPPDNIVNLLPNQKLAGEGVIQSGRNVQTNINVQALGQNLSLLLPSSPTFLINPGLTRPELANSPGDGVTMAGGSLLSGFVIDTPNGNGIFSNGAENTFINDTLVLDAGQSGIRLLATTGNTTITNTAIVASPGSLGASFHVDGGAGTVRFSSTDTFLLATIDNTSAMESVLIENRTGGIVDMLRSSVTDVGGRGVLIRSNTGGNATIDNVSVTNSSSSGIAVIDSAGTYGFRRTSTQLPSITIDNPAQQGILISNMSGRVEFFDNVLISNRNAQGIDISGSGGTTVFTREVILNDLGAGIGTEAAVQTQNQLANGIVNFRNNLIIRGTATRGSLGEGILLTNNDAASRFEIDGNVTITGTDGVSVLIDNNDGFVQFAGSTTINDRLVEGVAITNSAGAIRFGDEPGDLTSIFNPLDSQSSAILAIDNTANIVFGAATIDNAQGTPNAGAGVHLINNAGFVDFGALNINSLNGVALFGRDNLKIGTTSGDILTDNAAAIDIENSGIAITLESVTSIASQTYGIRLVETNKDNYRRFVVDPNLPNDAPGDGGTIAGAKGNGIDDNDSAGVYLENAGQVRLRAMLLDDNEFGVLIRNTETTPGIPNTIKQNFILERSLVQDSDIRGLDSQDLMGLSISNSIFDNNGDDPGSGRETIRLDYTTRLDPDSITTVAQANDPFVVLIQDSDFTSTTTDVIYVDQSTITARGAAIVMDVLRNTFTVSDVSDPAGSGLFDDAFIFNWNGPAQVRVDDNRFDMISPFQAQAVSMRTSSTTDLVELSVQRNTVNVNNVTLNSGAIDVRIDGPSFMNSNRFQIANNEITIGDGGAAVVAIGDRPTGLKFRLARNAEVAIISNDIVSTADGGTGILFERASASSFYLINGNRIAFNDLGIEPERGIIFSQVTGVIDIFGNVDNQVVTVGLGFVETPFFMPVGSNNGQIIVNGALVP